VAIRGAAQVAVPSIASPEYARTSGGHLACTTEAAGPRAGVGGLRFRLNSWYDIQQVGGGFESGLRNRTPVEFAYHIRTDIGSNPGMEVTDSIREMKALGVEYVIVTGLSPPSTIATIKTQRKFEGRLEKVYDTGADIVYRVPFHGLAHAIYPHEEPGWAFRDALEPICEGYRG
jgi:hypothetical protein